MNPMSFLLNAVNYARRLDRSFPGYYEAPKHNHYKDFGWPTKLEFSDFYGIYHRNSLATAAIDRTVLKTWQDDPEIWESEEPKESKLEKQIRTRFEDLMVWQCASEADRRAMIGGWSGLILRLADSKPFDQPVDAVPGGLNGLVEVIPAWGGDGAQLTVASWGEDPQKEDYGKPTMFNFNEAAVGESKNKPRSFQVHPDRVIVWSRDGSVDCESALKAGYNDLLDIEKVKGSGGEGFYKAARGNPVLQADKEVKLTEMAKSMGVSVSELADAMNEQVEDFQAGFDRMLFLQGMEAKTLQIALPTGDKFFDAPVNCFASSFLMPTRILMGNQTGERASTEDGHEWAIVNMARRNKQAKPRIKALLNRLERFLILPNRDWTIHWADLTEASQEQKVDRASKMAEINSKQQSEPAFLPEEIRAAAGYEGPSKTPRIRERKRKTRLIKQKAGTTQRIRKTILLKTLALPDST